ncbi:MAG: hypothetical protein IKX33_06685 [Prevotella sp.]|nr:hypothetical protein [Prevotella sp.]
MKVIVNNDEIQIFGGATAKDAIRRYFIQKGEKRTNNITIRDQWEHEIDSDAPLREGMIITFKINEEE